MFVSPQPNQDVRLLKRQVIQGTWTGIGAGGINVFENSPRNEHYTFEVMQDNSEFILTLTSSMGAAVRVYSETGQLVAGVGSGRRTAGRINRAGTYRMTIFGPRYATGNYELVLEGSVSNISKKTFPVWQQPMTSFGEEGGGGVGDNSRSPRNHSYTFEINQDTDFDINVESDGLPISIFIIDPSGRQTNGWRSNGWDKSPGITALVGKTPIRGLYTLYVCTQQVNGRGSYKIEAVGNLTRNPTRVQSNFQALKGQFTPTSKRHIFVIPCKSDRLEILYRSTTAEANYKIVDAYNQEMVPEWAYQPTNQLIDRTIKVPQPGTITLTLETQQPTAGAYELLVWGNFDEITRKDVRTPNNRPPQQPNSGQQVNQNGQDTDSNGKVFVTGHVKTSRSNTVFSAMRVIYEDLDTREKVGEAVPDRQGNYSFYLPIEHRYGITVISDNGDLSSSQNIDLGQGSTRRSQLVVPEITVISGEIGEVINLNNIFFQTGKSTLLPASYAELNRIGKFMADHPNIRIEIVGHTDNQGSDQLNRVLSNDRALSVAYNLQGQQVRSNRIRAVGFGATKPVAPNTTDSGRAANRRVEFRIVER